MAYAKKASRRRYRSNRYRRRTRRRRYRYRKYRRYYRRARRQRPEYKRLEFRSAWSFKANPVPIFASNQNKHVVQPFWYDFFCIGASNPPSIPNKCINIENGSGINQRIGAKIRPTAIRFFGTLSIYNENQDLSSNTLNEVGNVNGCMFRMIVFQIRNGNNDVSPLTRTFSEVNPFVVNYAGGVNDDYPLNNYNNLDATYFASPDWFSRFFSVKSVIEQDTQVKTVDDTQKINVVDYIDDANRAYFGTYAKCPYRAGIGTYMKILKDKLYYFNPTTHPTFSFRFKTKKPYRMVWKESATQENTLESNCKNPIYIVCIPIFPVGISQAKIEMNLNCQFYYTDK